MRSFTSIKAPTFPSAVEPPGAISLFIKMDTPLMDAHCFHVHECWMLDTLTTE